MVTGFFGSSNTLLNRPPMTAPASPPSNGDTGKGRLFEMDAPMVANDADAAKPDDSVAFTC